MNTGAIFRFQISGGLRAIAATIAGLVLLALASDDSLAQVKAAGDQRAAGQAGWSVERTEGDVRVVMPATVTLISVSPHQVLPPSTEISTEHDGTIMLRHQRDVIVVRPNSRVVLPAREGQGFIADVIQRIGTAFYQVEPRRSGGFRVETPILTATVKGTSFTVAVSTSRASVSVTSGIVSVAKNSAPLWVDVSAGMTASVSAATDAQMGVGPTSPASDDAAPASPAGQSASVGVEANANSGGVSGGASASGAGPGGGGVGASAGAGASAGSSGASAGASAGVGAGSGGVSASAGVGGIGVGASAGIGGVGAGVGDGSTGVGGGVGSAGGSGR